MGRKTATILIVDLAMDLGRMTEVQGRSVVKDDGKVCRSAIFIETEPKIGLITRISFILRVSNLLAGQQSETSTGDILTST